MIDVSYIHPILSQVMQLVVAGCCGAWAGVAAIVCLAAIINLRRKG